MPHYRVRAALFACFLIFLLMSLFTNPVLAANTVVKPSASNGWSAANVRSNATVAITATQPRAGVGSLEFNTDTIISGQDKADFEKVWNPTVFTGRKLANLTALSYEYFRDSASTTGANFVPVLRLYVFDPGSGKYATLIWEYAYNHNGAVPTDAWQMEDVLNGKFWMFVPSGQSIPSGVVQNYNSTLSDWISGSPTGQSGDPTPVNIDANTLVIGINTGVGSGWGNKFHGFVDNIFANFGNGDVESANFEAETPCTTVCYANAVTGNDLFGGDTPNSAKKSIQAAIDAVQPGGQVHVFPGAYTEQATNRYVLPNSQNNGPHQFGLFVAGNKAGIAIVGVTAADAPIADYNNVLAQVTTNATNNFGYSGIFVEGDNVTIQGLKILDNMVNGQPDNNKTIEVIGDGFTLKNSHIAVSDGGAVYLGDWRFDTNANTSYMKAYTIEANFFDLGAQVALANGVGFSGPLSGRQIKNNKFVNADDWPSISFNGAGGVPWYEHPVGGAVIEGNNFTNTHVGTGPGVGHIRARGTYDNTQFDWTAWWNNNTFNKAVVALDGTFPPFAVRPYSYASNPYTFTNVRRIGATIQDGVNDSIDGATVLVNDGTYPETLSVDKAVKLLGEQHGVCAKDRPGMQSIIRVASGGTVAVDIRKENVTVDGFKFDLSGATPPWTITAINKIGGGAFNNIQFLNNEFTGNPGAGNTQSDPGGVYVADSTNTLFECNYFNDLGSHAVFMGTTSDRTTYRNNDSFSNYLSNFSAHVGPHTNVLVENNRAVQDDMILFKLNGATIRNNQLTTSASESARIYLGGGDTNVSVENNTFIGARKPIIQAFDAGFGYGVDSAITIKNNSLTTGIDWLTDKYTLIDLRDVAGTNLIDGNTINITPSSFSSGVTAFSGIGVRGNMGPTTIQNNTLNGGNVDSGAPDESSGILLRDTLVAGAQINVQKNVISGFNNGVETGAYPAGVVAHVNRNAVANNNVAGVKNGSASVLDGQCNWWGDVSGPSGSGPGAGAVVSANVSFNPWLGSNNLDGPCATPAVQFELATQVVDEGIGNAALVVKLSEVSGQIITVHYATSDGTALAGDYTAQSGTLTFNPGDTSQTINLPIADDNLDESNETLNVTLSSPNYATLGTQTNTTLTIVDNDPLPVVQFSSPTVAVNENAGAALIAATLNTPSGRDVRVNYSTSDGTALAGSDYTANSGQLIIPAGQMSASFVVPITNDTLVEPNETINLQLDTPANASLGTANATLTILDDDTGPLVNFSHATYSVNEAAGTATVTVTLSSAAANVVTVAYATSVGSATAGSDYTAVSGTLTFNPGETSQTFTVPIINDGQVETNETVLLKLSAPNGASLGAPANATLTIIDNDGAPIVEGQSATFLINENVSNGLATVTVDLSTVATQTVTVHYATRNGTATAGSDYVATGGVLTFVPGQTSQSFTISILDDSLDETDESVLITLSAPTNANLGALRDLVLLIVDDDPPPSVQFNSSTYTTNEGAGTALLTVMLSTPSGITVTVPYTVNGNTVVQSSQVEATNGIVVFTPGQTTQTLAIPIADDNIDQGNRTLSVTLGVPSHATLGAQKSTTLTIVENDGVSGAAATKLYLPVIVNQ